MRGLLLTGVLILVATAAAAELPSASDAEATAALASGKPTLIDLGSRGCPSCTQMAPVLEELAGAHRGRANVLFIDVREDGAAARRFAIRLIPTQIFFDAAGREVSRHVGALDHAGLVQGLRAAGVQ